jgi:hypothetical protein
MKKLVAFMLCLVVLMSCTITAFADNGLAGEGTSAESTVTYHVDSNFCVIIPETVDAYNGFQLSASYMNITNTEQVSVYVNGENSITMTNDEGDTFNLKFNLNDNDRVAKFAKNQTTSDTIVYGQQEDGNMPAAGDYIGTVEFIVRLESKD